MNIRLMGSEDIVRAWAEKLARAFGVEPGFYPNRGPQGGMRAYLNVDDRAAEQAATPAKRKRRLAP